MNTIIFILDDDEATLSVIKTLLKCENRVIKVFHNETKMLADDDLPNVDLFIIDIRLNGRDGIKVATDLSVTHPGIPFLFISGYDSIDTSAYDLAHDNVVDFVPKPIETNLLINRVSVLLKASIGIRKSMKHTDLVEIEKQQLMEESGRIRRLFAGIFHSSPVAIAISSAETGKLIEVNSAYIELVGYSKDYLLGRSTLDVGIWEDPIKRDLALQDIKRKGRLQNFEAKVKTESGQIRDCIFFGETLDVGSDEDLILTLAIDITERKNLTESLWNVFNYSTFFALVIDTNFKVKLCNYALAKALGFESEDEVVGSVWMNFIPHSVRNVIEHVVHQLVEADPAYLEFTNDIVSKDGTVITVKWFNSYVNQDTHQVFSIGMPLSKEISMEETADSLRAYFTDILQKDQTTIRQIKEKASL